MKLVKAISLPGLIKATSFGEAEYGQLLACPNNYQRILAKFKENLPIEISAYRSGPNIVSEFNENLLWATTPKRVDDSLILNATAHKNGVLVAQVNENTSLRILEVPDSEVPKSSYLFGLKFFNVLTESKVVGTGPILFPTLDFNREFALEFNREFAIEQLASLRFKQADVEKTVQKILFSLDEHGVKAYVKTTHFVRSVPPTPQALTPFVFGLFRNKHPLPYLIGRVE